MRFINLASKFFSLWLYAGAVCLSMTGCEQKVPLSALEQIKKEGVLHVVTRNSPVTYFEDKNGPTGFEYELAKRFAKHLGVDLQVELVDSIDGIYEKVATSKKPIIAAAGLVNIQRRREQVDFSSAFSEVKSEVIFHKENARPTSIKDLLGKSILVIKGGSQAELLKELQQTYPTLTYQESDAVDIVDLLQLIEEKKIDITLINSNELAITQVYYPNVRVGFSLSNTLNNIVWAVTKQEGDDSVLEAVNDFLALSKQDGSLARLADRFYGHIDTLGYVGAYTFAKHLQTRLPLYEKYFIEYGKQYQLDWKLIAAIGYQESHWDPSAKSRTGVRGLMMLTLTTAKAMGVTDRLSPEQSIMGGAKLLALLKQSVDKEVLEPDRTYFALAAYNMGQGHLLDAQKLAGLQGLDGKLWRSINAVLPLLSKKQWYTQTRYGYARGFETKQFVRNVRRYYDILSWLESSQREMPVMANKDIHIPGISEEQPSRGTVL